MYNNTHCHKLNYSERSAACTVNGNSYLLKLLKLKKIEINKTGLLYEIKELPLYGIFRVTEILNNTSGSYYGTVTKFWH